MKHLLLLRHAKSSWSHQALGDFERPLNDRGKKAAATMSKYLADGLPLPDLIYCSSSQRTRETLTYLSRQYVHAHDIRIMRDLYLASDLVMLEKVRKTPMDVQTIMIIAHNPGTEELALSLSKNTSGESFVNMMNKYPTAACAHLSFDVEQWSDVKKGQGTLNMFVRPRDLMTNEEEADITGDQ